MGILSDLTLEQLRQATVTQIRTAISNKLANLTKKQLIILILKVADIDVEDMEVPDKEIGEDGVHGQISRLRVIRDILGNKLKSSKIDWSYYPGGEVDIITQSKLDALDAVINVKKIKHFLDGRQPKEI